MIAHPHSAGWSSGDWHRPIINLPFHWCPLGFFLLPFFFFFLFSLFSFFFFIIFLILTSVLLIFKIFFFFFLSFSFKFSFLFFSFIPHLLFFFFNLCLFSSTLYHLSMHVLVMSIDSKFVFEFIA